MSRQELAEAVNTYLWDTYQQDENLDENDIGKLERGDHRWPGARRREALRAMLQTDTDAELGLYINRRTRACPRGPLTDESTVPADEAVIVKIVVDGRVQALRLSRRGLFEAAAGSLMAPLLNAPVEVPRPVNPAVVDHFAALRALLVDSDNRLGAGGVLPTVRHELGLIAQFRREARGPLHDQLLSTEARWAEFAGWLCDDLGNNAEGAWWLSQSMSMAHEANDLDFSAYLFARMAQRAVCTADEDRILGLAQAATRVGTTHRHVLAFAALQRSHGHALAGDKYQFESMVGKARTLVEGRAARDGELGAFCAVPYVKQVVPAQRAAPILPGEQAQVVAVERGFDPPPSGSPVVGQVRVVRRRRAFDHLVPDNVGPGKLHQVGNTVFVGACAVAEHPPVAPELVEPAEVASHDPRLRLVGVGVLGPLVEEPPHVTVQ
jgi:hypothetical protein